jgi:hypothetical protein
MFFIVALKGLVNYINEEENITVHIKVVPNQCLFAV